MTTSGGRGLAGDLLTGRPDQLILCKRLGQPGIGQLDHAVCLP